MKKHFLKFLSLLMAATFISGAAYLTMFSRAEAYVYETGDTVEFGSYPQTKVTDSDTVAALDSVNKNWVSYRFYSGEGNYGSIPAYGSMTAGDFAKYADIELNGEKYRAVLFDDYRPLSTINKSDTNGQTRNGYYKNKIYYFKYEPLTWKVLDPSTGLILCEKLIDTQAYNNEVYWIDLNGDSKTDYYTEFFNDYDGTIYANNYEHSSIREWLNNDFYTVAFNETEVAFVAETELTDVIGSNGEAVSDFVFLPSYDDLVNTVYGFSNSPAYDDPTRSAESTDYSKCLGNYAVNEIGNEYLGRSSWTIRSANQKSSAVSAVKVTGRIALNDAPTYDASNGIRPAIRIPSVVEREYVLSFNANGGSGAPQSVSDKTNTVSVPITEPTYEGHYFKGWSTDKNAVEPSVMPGNDMRLTDDITLYAVWGKNSYKTVWKSDGIEIDSKTVLFGESVTAPANPQKDGFTFIGWNPEVPAKMPAKDIEFNAKWEANSHTVTWIVADKRTTVNYKYGDTVSVPQNPVLEGYTFMGWDKAIPDTVPDKDLVFTAVLKANQYTVTWNIDGVKTSQTVDFSAAFTSPAVPKKEGYVFKGWSPAVPDKMPAHDVEFTAVYEKSVLTHIEIVSKPSKTTYVYKSNDSLSTDGLKIRAYYSDGTSKVIDDASQMTFSGFSTKKPVGTKEIRVEYQGASTTFEIKVQYVWWQQIIRIFLLGFLWY